MEHMTPEQRQALGAGLRRQYEAGDTIHVLAVRIGRSYGFTHKILTQAGTTMRRPGGAPR